MTQTIAILPMKGHSSRVPGKNLRSLAGKPLYHWITMSLLNARSIDRIVVETDSDAIESDVRAHFPRLEILRRPVELHGDDVPMNDIIACAMERLGPAIYVQTHSTNPLLTAQSIDKALDMYRAPGTHDSLFSVTVWQTRFFWRDGKPVNHNPQELIPTQNLPPLLEENSNIYIFTPESFRLRNHRIGATPLLYEMQYTEAVDIDEMHQFEMAEALILYRQSAAGKPKS